MRKLIGFAFMVALIVVTVIAHVFWPDSHWVKGLWWFGYLCAIVVVTIICFVAALRAGSFDGDDDYDRRKGYI